MTGYQASSCDKALKFVEKAIENNPRSPQLHNTHGVILEAMGRLEPALAAYRRAAALDPNYAEPYSNMAIALQARAMYCDAVENCRKALKLQPDQPQVYNTMGFALKNQGKFAEAVDSYKRAVTLKPDYPEPYNHLGVLSAAQGRYEQAIDNYRAAIEIDPEYAEAHWNLSLALLMTGRLAEGWQHHRWRHSPDLKLLTYPHQYRKPRWDGADFQSKTLLVHYEQGFGDTIQFVRYLPMIKERGGTVILEVPRSLVRLLQGFDGVDELIEASFDTQPAIDFDMHISLMDLPGIFNTTLETIPAHVPYIHTDLALVESWKEMIAGDHFKVGIVWSGSTDYERNHLRSCNLADFEPLSRIDGVRLYSLQKAAPAAQIDQWTGRTPIIDLASHFRDFKDAAAAIQNLDLVVSVDTSVLHLAAAMAKPVWALICSKPAWQWMLHRTDSPWYPTMTLFRQQATGQWHHLFRRLADQLEALVGKTHTAKSKD